MWNERKRRAASRALPAALAALTLSASGTRLQAQEACAYRECALSIAPTWNGLAVVRGASGPHVANLHFFFPRDIRAAFIDRFSGAATVAADSALREATRAVHLRRAGAALTDVGLLLAGYVAVRGLREGRLDRADRAVAAVGGASLAVSVPLQFMADGALSRAVWWHNARYAR